jgi:hypothetical protein
MNARPYVTREFAEMTRCWIWKERGYKNCPDDYDPVTGRYPALVDGVCRHKATWLCDALGGKVIYGFRTDCKKPEFHAALLIRIDGSEYIIDHDKIWPASDAPFDRRESPTRSMPHPWYEQNGVQQ